MTIRKCLYAVITLIAVAVHGHSFASDSTISLEGTVPPSITDTFVMRNYLRLWMVLAPAVPADKNQVHIIYYSKNSAQKLGIRLPEWGGGGAVGRDTIVVPVERAMMEGMDAGRVTVHELVHIVLARAYGGLGLPRWFHEGVAMTLSGEVLFEEQVVISRALFTHRLLTFAQIEGVNSLDEYGAALAYSQSHLAVAFLMNDYGFDTLPPLLAAVRETGRFDTAIARVLGFSAGDIEMFAREYIVKRYSFVFLLSDTALYWVPITLLFVAAFIAVTLRNRKRRRMMAEEERREDEEMEVEDGQEEQVTDERT